jgi:hypothetical protein
MVSEINNVRFVDARDTYVKFPAVHSLGTINGADACHSNSNALTSACKYLALALTIFTYIRGIPIATNLVHTFPTS